MLNFLLTAPARNWIVAADMQSFPLIYSGEKQILTFDMTKSLVAPNSLVTPAQPTITVTCVLGNDNDPQGILNGGASVDSTGLLIQVGVAPTIPGVQYLVKVNAASNNPLIAPSLAAFLQVGV